MILTDKEMELACASTASTPAKVHSNLELPSLVAHIPPRQLLRHRHVMNVDRAIAVQVYNQG